MIHGVARQKTAWILKEKLMGWWRGSERQGGKKANERIDAEKIKEQRQASKMDSPGGGRS
jgi:hypothetical protein